MINNSIEDVYEALLFCLNYNINEIAVYCRQQIYIKQLEKVHWSQVIRLRELIEEGYDVNNPDDKIKMEYFLKVANLKVSHKIDTSSKGKCKIIDFSSKRPN